MTTIIIALVVGIIIGALAMAWFLPRALNDAARGEN
jgi:uncharacterized membrane-anchored protein YhcB (DUF1043 family)